MGRPLGIFETAETLTDRFAPFNVVGVIELAAELDPAALRVALDRAQRRHPLLHARIVDREGVYHYDLDEVPPIPLEVVDRESEDHWRQTAESELNRPFELGAGPFMRSTLLIGEPGTGAAELILSFLHTIIDGSSATNLVHEILADCDAIAAGRSLDDVEGLDLQPPVETFFPPAYRGAGSKLRLAGFMARQLADEIGYRHRARGTRRMPIHETGRCRVLNRTLSGDRTERLVRAARRHRVTLHSVLNAAMLLVVQRRLYDGAAVPLRNFNFAVLRPYLQPPVDDRHLGSFHVMLRSTIDLKADQALWPLASTVNDALIATAKRGDKYLALLAVADVMRFILGRRTMRMGSTALAYTGPLPLPESIGAIRLRGVRAMVSNLALGPEVTVHARLWRRRLWWDNIYLDSDMDADTAAGITDDILELLRRTGREAT